MNMNDSFFDNIEIINQNVITYNKPQTICKSLERTFAVCSNPPKYVCIWHYIISENRYLIKHFIKKIKIYKDILHIN